MKTLIVYTSKYGFTEDCVGQLMDRLEGDVLAVDLQKGAVSGIAAFDRVIVGGSIYMGQIHKKLKSFCETQLDALLAKPTGLFLCCGLPENFDQSLQAAFPATLIDSAAAIACFGGELRTERMKGPDRLICGMMKKATASQGKGEVAPMPENIAKFASDMKRKGN